MRNLSTGEGYRYAYEDGRLATVVAIGQPGVLIEYGADGSVVERAVAADLGGAGEFQGQNRGGNRAAGEAALYTFSIRGSEIAGTAGGQLLLRVEVIGDALPSIPGLTPLSMLTGGGRTVALFGIRTEGLYQLELGGVGGGAYALSMAVAGDLNADGSVDGADSAVFGVPGAVADITGDGVTDRADRQVLYANYGFVLNRGPQLAPVLPNVFTHADLRAMLDLDLVARDPDGDAVFYRITDASHGVAVLAPDGRSVIFRPDAGYAGAASFTLTADDGYSSTQEATVQVTVSDAPLLSMEFDRRRLLLAEGASTVVDVIGHFADQTGVRLTAEFANLRTRDGGIASVTDQGLVSGLSTGTTALVASRAGATVATVVGVGEPASGRLAVSRLFGIDAYPDTVTLLPEGGARQVVVSLGSNQEVFVSSAADGTRYFTGNAAVATVDAEGLIRAVGVGDTTITVVHGYAEEVLKVSVRPPLSTNGSATVGAEGGVVANAQGYAVGFGEGQLKGDAAVTVTTVAEADLPLPLPRSLQTGEQTFSYLGAFDLDIQGGTLDGPVQVALPVQGGFTPGGSCRRRPCRSARMAR